MLSTQVGRILLLTSNRVTSQKFASYALNSSHKITNATDISSLRFGNKFSNLQARQFSKTNFNSARFGRAGPDRTGTPVGINAKHVGTMNSYGMLAIGAAGATGLGALCYYGLGMSNVEGALERSILWPQYVKDRIQSTYAHLGGSIIISGAAAYATLNSPAAMRFLSRGSLLVALGSFAALIASSIVVQSIPYEPGMGVKQLAWIGHCSTIGFLLAPLSMFGGPVILRAATYTAGIVGGLSAIAVCAPSERFLNNTAPLSIGLGLVVASSLGSLFLPPTSKLGLGLYGISLYGGLILFSGMLLYDTQKTIKRAELHPTYSMAPYDPINNSLHIYMDIINIFIRVVQILGMSGSQRRK